MKIILVATFLIGSFITTPVTAHAEPPAKDLVTVVDMNDEAAVREILKNPETVRKELDPVCPSNTMCKPVSFAAKNGSVAIMKLLLEAGADVNGATGGSGDTPLMLAMMNDKSELVRLLVERGADVNKPNKFGATAFWAACAMGNAEYVKLFLSKGGNKNQKGRYPDRLSGKKEIVTGITPLMIASIGGFGEVVKLLLQNGASILAVDSLGRTALDYAKASPDSTITSLFNHK